MSDDNNSGKAALNSDLDAMEVALDDSKTIESFRRAIADASLSFSEMREQLGDHFRLILYLSNASLAKEIVSNLGADDSETAGRMAAVGARFLECVPRATTNPVLVDAGEQALEQSDGLNRISRIASYRWYGQAGAGIQPFIRMRFFSGDDKQIFESNFTWDDLAFLCRALAEILDEDMDRVEPVLQSEQLLILRKSKLAKNLAGVEEVLGRIQGKTAKFDIREVNPDGRASS